MSTREHILETAMTIFSRQGFKNTTIKEIAQKADVNSLTIFRNFYDKKALFLEAVERMKVSNFDPESFDKTLTYSDVEADLLEMAKAYLYEIYANLPLIRIYVGDSFNFDELKDEAWFIMPNLKAHFLLYLEKLECAAPLAREYGELLAEMFIAYITRKVMPHDKSKPGWVLTPGFVSDFIFHAAPHIRYMATMITGQPHT